MRHIYCNKCKCNLKELEHFTFGCYLCDKIFCINCAKYKTNNYVNVCDLCIDILNNSEWDEPKNDI